MENEDKTNLETLKLEYKKVQEKYNLPEFDNLNRDFYIEKISDTETDYFLREIVKFMGEKIFNFVKFIEGILNPTNASMFIFSIVKSISVEEKKKLSEVYKILSRFEIDLLELDLSSSEEKEAEFIKNLFDEWQNVKKEILDVVNVIKDNWDKKFEVNGNNKNYFG
jgi:hypothetical protein